MNTRIVDSACAVVDRRLSVSGYDRINAFLLACLFLTGSLATGLFCAWLVAFCQPFSDNFIDPRMDAVLAGETEASGDMSIDEPTPSEMPELGGPQISKSISSVLAAVQNLRHPPGSGYANSGIPGPPGVFRKDRGPGIKTLWAIDLSATDRATYFRQLDFFGIEIVCVEKVGNDVFRLTALSGDVLVANSSKLEERENGTVLFGHRNSRLTAWDRKIATEAGIEVKDFAVGQVLPESLFGELRELESDYAKSQGREPDEIRETRFRIADSESGPKFEITEQKWGKPQE